MSRQLFIFISTILIIILMFAGCRGLLTRQDEADRAAINKLHRLDQKASLNQDFDTLISLWTDDAVMLPPDSDPVVGKEAIERRIREWEAASEGTRMLKYEHVFEELHLEADWAFEWGTFTAEVLVVADKDTIRQQGKLIRILQRQKDDNWKVARSMWVRGE